MTSAVEKWSGRDRQERNYREQWGTRKRKRLAALACVESVCVKRRPLPGLQPLEGQFLIRQRQPSRHAESSVIEKYLQLASQMIVVSARSKSFVSETLSQRSCAQTERSCPRRSWTAVIAIHPPPSRKRAHVLRNSGRLVR
jgi:hypothetical protein